MRNDQSRVQRARRSTRSSFCILHSSFRIRRARRRRSGYTLIEFFVTIAILIIVFGLMVDLARRVRRNSADRLTRQLLQQLTALMENYTEHNGGQPPPVTPFFPSGTSLDEAELQATARANNAGFVRLLRGQTDLTRPTTTTAAAAVAAAPSARDLLRGRPQDLFSGLPLSLYNEVTLHDPWGSPIVFMPRQHPLIGMAPGDRFFFFSAGPDRRFLTRDDNLYSYEDPPEPAAVAR
jgi:type II secretory pathway pseudopilin PulG